MRIKRPLIVAKERTKISKTGNRIVVETEGKRNYFPIGAVKFLILFPAVEITSSALRYLSRENRPVFFFNSYGKLDSIVYPELFFSSNASLRAKQYESFSKESFCVEITKNLLLRKFKEIVDITGINVLDTEKKIKEAQTLETLLGLDGSISKELYDFFRRSNKSSFSFTKRTYYPPEDPINAVLSFSFSFFYSYLKAAIISAGLDPYFGFFHKRRGTHAALSSDIIEICRPKIVEFVFSLFNANLFKDSDFRKTKDGVVIEREKIKELMKLLIEFEIDKFISEKSVEFLKFLTRFLRGE